MTSPRTLFIVNPAAGAGRAARRWGEWERRLRQAGLPAERVVSQHPGHAVRLAAEAAPRYDALVAVAAEPAIEVQADGELIGHTPARFQVHPRALRLWVP